MSSFNYNVTANVKRSPFIDKTNLIRRENSKSTVLSSSTLPKKSTFKSSASIDPKLKLITKVHLQSCSIINNELSSTSNHLESKKFAIEQIISTDPKFALIPKVHLQSCSIVNKEHSNASDHLEFQKTIEQIISNDPKFTLMPKVHLESCSIIDKELSSAADHFESQKVAIEQAIISKDPKFMLNLKVHLQFCSIISKELSSASDHLESQKSVIEQIISKDPKFTLIPKVHLQSCSIINKELSSSTSADHFESQKVATEPAISKDPKFTLMPKVHLQRLNIKDKMPNLPSTKFGNHYSLTKNEIIGKNSTKSNNKSKEVESYFKGGNSTFLRNGGNEIDLYKEGNALQKRGIKDYAELSITDTLSPENNIKQSYPNSTAIAQDQKEKDPIESLPDALSDAKKKGHRERSRKEISAYFKKLGRGEDPSDSSSYDEFVHKILKETRQKEQKEKDPIEYLPDALSDAKKKRHRGRSRKEISAYFKKLGRGEHPSDSDSSLYDEFVQKKLKERRQKVSPKKCKHVKRVNVKRNNDVKVVTKQINNRPLQIARKSIEQETNDCDRYFGFDEDSEDDVNSGFGDFSATGDILAVSTPTKNNHNTSRFDDNDFSPIRNKNSPPNEDEKLETSNGKENIFRISTNSPLAQRNREEECGIENYFGFNSSDNRHTIGKENVRIASNRADSENNINEETLSMMRQVREEAVEEVLNEIKLEKNFAEEPAVQEIVDVSRNEEPQDDDIPLVGLFEDLAEVNLPQHIYEGKRIKRTRAVSLDADIGEEEKRKRKDWLTSAEEEEFNKWAASFNVMCNEVEKQINSIFFD